ncbi:MAG TPA: lytic transglycosylase domain-containing protein [Salinivirga sp.]|uniref:lytic transglycosylase domain-containing protein n=1 Tax=Salinivirga sp. TaxID=1970192 RepID=UPI002B46449B|nr:lytic transglycosylase domain-containing protein [Salinivirga sp.]HKK59091.1 lytic transglycosylase domain-containing protein [Salinivirga sp.]
MKIKTISITAIMLVALLWIIKYSYKQKETTEIYQSEETDNDAYVVEPADMPAQLIFADEVVPVQFYDVRERLDRELLVNKFWHSSTFQLIKRANRYFPIIERILKEEQVPEDFKYLAVAESGLQNVVSPSGAAGFWQFLRGAARDFDLQVNSEVDERYHLEKATRAAAKYLKWNYKKFGTWTMSAAAYNYGRTNTLRQIKRQHCSNYYDLLLPEETERYVFRLIALKLILSNPAEYGFTLNNNDLYAPIKTKTVTVTGKVKDLATFAKNHGISYRMLKEFNPWLRENYLRNPRNKTYKIKIPEKHFRHQYDHLSY